MTKFKKILIGIATGFATVSFAAFMIFLEYGPTIETNSIQSIFILLTAFFVIFYTFICIGGYWGIISDSKKIDPEKKKYWYAVLVLFHIAVMPVYWFIFIWKKPQDEIS